MKYKFNYFAAGACFILMFDFFAQNRILLAIASFIICVLSLFGRPFSKWIGTKISKCLRR